MVTDEDNPCSISFDTRFNVWQDCRLMYARLLRRRIVPEMRVHADSPSTGEVEQWQRCSLAYIGDSVMRNCAQGTSTSTTWIPFCRRIQGRIKDKDCLTLVNLLYSAWNHRLPTRADWNRSRLRDPGHDNSSVAVRWHRSARLRRPTNTMPTWTLKPEGHFTGVCSCCDSKYTRRFV